MEPYAVREAVGRVHRNALGKIKVDCGDDDVAERAHTIGRGEIGQARAPRFRRQVFAVALEYFSVLTMGGS